MRYFMRSETGFTLVEYGLVAAVIALVVMFGASAGSS
jgi:Flp pilus assembly pilin Flp